MTKRYRVLARLLALCLAAGFRPAHGAELIPMRAFFELPAYSQPKLSPDGKHLTLLSHSDNRVQITLIDLATMQPKQIGLLDQHGFVLDYWWKGADRLLLYIGSDITAPVFRSLDVNTQKMNPLNALNSRAGKLVHAMAEDPDNVIMSADPTAISSELPLAGYFPDRPGLGYDLRRVSVQTGKMSIIEKRRLGVYKWIANSQGEAVAAFGREDLNWFMLVRKNPREEWARIPLGTDYLPQFQPVIVHQDQRRLIGWDFSSRPTVSAAVCDPATGGMEMLFQSPEVDADQLLLWGDDLTHGVAIGYEVDTPRRQFIDPEAATTMGKIDAGLTGRINAVTSRSADGAVMVVHSQTDRNPGEYYLLNTRRGQMSSLGATHPTLPEAAMLPGRFFRFKSRDGLDLTGRIILPAGSAGKPPLLLIVGPEINGPRARYEFNASDQLLASRGYAVARINYRGTPGFGRPLLDAGAKQAAEGAPRDLEDGVRWLIDQGWIDGKRAGIIGDGYGGLVAMQTLARTDLFTAWINLNSPFSLGEIDIEALYRPWKRDNMMSRESRLVQNLEQRVPLSYGISVEHDYAISYEEKVEKENVIPKLGGVNAAWEYRKSLDPRAVLDRIGIPSFHYYSQGGRDAEAYATKAGSPAVFLRGRSAIYNDKHYQNQRQARVEQQIETYTQLLDFLNMHLPVAGR